MMRRTDNQDFVFSWFNTLLVAITILLVSVVAAKSEKSFDFDMLHGLFTPTQSERFFQAGRENFEQEIEIFNHPERYLRDDVLQITPELIDQMKEPRQSEDFTLDNVQYELYRDRQ